MLCSVASVVSDSLQPHQGGSPTGSSVHRTLWARILEWVAISFSRGSFPPRDLSPALVGGFFTSRATFGVKIFGVTQSSFPQKDRCGISLSPLQIHVTSENPLLKCYHFNQNVSRSGFVVCGDRWDGHTQGCLHFGLLCKWICVLTFTSLVYVGFFFFLKFRVLQVNM